MNFKQSNSDEFSAYENNVLIASTKNLTQTQKAAPTHV